MEAHREPPHLQNGIQSPVPCKSFSATTASAPLSGMELASVPTWAPEGKQHFMGGLLLADEFALWGKRIRVLRRHDRA